MQLDYITQQCFINMEGQQQHMDHKEMSDALCVRQRLPVMWDTTVHYKPIKEKETYKRTTKCWAVKFLKTNGIYYLQDNATSNATGSYILKSVLLNMAGDTT